MLRPEKSIRFALCLVFPLAALVGCGGGGGGTSSSSDGKAAYSQTYTDPPLPTGTNVYAPVIKRNATLSTSTTAVFDVMANAPATNVRGVVCNLQVDMTKATFVPVPGESGGAIVSTGGFGGTGAFTKGLVLADGTNLMVVAIRRPATSEPASGVLMRFALAVNPSAVAGVVRAQVQSGSGLVGDDGRIIANTSPVLGRLEIVKS